MPRSFLFSWWTIPSLVLRFACFLNLQVTQPCEGGKERGASNIGNFCNKTKHNISPMIIPMLPVSLTFSTASESLNSSSSTNPHRLHHYNRNDIATYPLPQPNPPLPKSDTITATVLWMMCLKNTVFLAEKLASLTRNTC